MSCVVLKSASFLSESEFSGRGAAEVHIKLFRRRHEPQSKTSLETFQIYFVYLFQIDKFFNTY
jgi:hypothetical protein